MQDVDDRQMDAEFEEDSERSEGEQMEEEIVPSQIIEDIVDRSKRPENLVGRENQEDANCDDNDMVQDDVDFPGIISDQEEQITKPNFHPTRGSTSNKKIRLSKQHLAKDRAEQQSRRIFTKGKFPAKIYGQDD